jgi:hypothetical protein
MREVGLIRDVGSLFLSQMIDASTFIRIRILVLLYPMRD